MVGEKAYLTVLALYKDGSRGIVGLYNNFTEESALGEELFTELQKRGRG